MKEQYYIDLAKTLQSRDTNPPPCMTEVDTESVADIASKQASVFDEYTQ